MVTVRISDLFKSLRADRYHHQGYGDVRLTFTQQDEISQRERELENLVFEARSILNENMLDAAYTDWFKKSDIALERES